VAGNYVIVAQNIKTTGSGASIMRKQRAYAVGNTVQQAIAQGVAKADINYDMRHGFANVPVWRNIVIAAPNTPPALAAIALANGQGNAAQHKATIAAYLPHLIAAGNVAFSGQVACPAPVLALPAPTATPAPANGAAATPAQA
jgi:hypothetical protein